MNFLEKFYGTLFKPNETFEYIKNEPDIKHAILIVMGISTLNTLVNTNASSFFLIPNIVGAAIGGLFSWFLFGYFIDLIISIGSKTNKLKEFLTLSAFSLLPWIFLPCINLFKVESILGVFFGGIFGLTIWLWAVILLFLAIMKNYEISLGKTLLLMIIPFASMIIAFNWIFGFFFTLGGLIK